MTGEALNPELANAVHRALLDADLRVVVKTGTGSDWGEFGTYDDQIEAMTSALLRAELLRLDDPDSEMELLHAGPQLAVPDGGVTLDELTQPDPTLALVADRETAIARMSDICARWSEGADFFLVPVPLGWLRALSVPAASDGEDETSTEWGVRWSGNPDYVEHQPDYTEAGLRAYIADMGDPSAVLVRRRGPGPWTEATQ